MEADKTYRIKENNQFIAFKGRCARCDRDEQELPVIFDEHFVCDECSRVLQAEVESLNLTQCAECLRLVAAGWGKPDEETNEFNCTSCRKRGRCDVCRTTKAALHFRRKPTGDGYQKHCQLCLDKMTA